MAETRYKLGRRKGFTVVYRSVAQDKRLSLKARGLFLLMQSLPDDWTLSQSRLAALAGAGRDQIRAALKELESVGYLVVEQSHDGGGRFAQTLYVLQEEAPAAPPPLSENPTTVTPEKPPLSGNPSTENPSSENPTVLENITCINTPLPPEGETPRAECKTQSPSMPKWKPERFARFWNFYREYGRGENRSGAVRAWDRLKADDNTINLMAIALSRQIDGELWRQGKGIPYASTWLNNRRWEDTPPDTPGPDDFLPDDLLEA